MLAKPLTPLGKSAAEQRLSLFFQQRLGFRFNVGQKGLEFSNGRATSSTAVRYIGIVWPARAVPMRNLRTVPVLPAANAGAKTPNPKYVHRKDSLCLLKRQIESQMNWDTNHDRPVCPC